MYFCSILVNKCRFNRDSGIKDFQHTHTHTHTYTRSVSGVIFFFYIIFHLYFHFHLFISIISLHNKFVWLTDWLCVCLSGWRCVCVQVCAIVFFILLPLYAHTTFDTLFLICHKCHLIVCLNVYVCVCGRGRGQRNVFPHVENCKCVCVRQPRQLEEVYCCLLNLLCLKGVVKN